MKQTDNPILFLYVFFLLDKNTKLYIFGYLHINSIVWESRMPPQSKYKEIIIIFRAIQTFVKPRILFKHLRHYNFVYYKKIQQFNMLLCLSIVQKQCIFHHLCAFCAKSELHQHKYKRIFFVIMSKKKNKSQNHNTDI